jgi:hypothetical protein
VEAGPVPASVRCMGRHLAEAGRRLTEREGAAAGGHTPHAR